MNAFFHRNVIKGLNTLSSEESQHCIRVLRQQVGDEILVLDGQGGKHTSVITSIARNLCVFEVIKSELVVQKSFYTHIAIAPTKNIDRMEWLVEKLTEIGTDEISLIESSNSERRKLRIDRLEKKALSALKQSKNAHLPKINDFTDFNDLIKSVRESIKLIAHIDANYRHIKEAIPPKKDILVLIGPEGDFSLAEVKIAKDNGFQTVSLGQHTLRTETAGFAACCFINFVNDY